MFIIITFLLICLMSYALGTSFGVAGTAGVIFMTLARSGNVDPALSPIIDGGGVISMLGTVVIVAIACSYTGILNGTGLINSLRSTAGRLESRVGLFPSVLIISFASACVFCNQVVGIIMSNELMKESYQRKGKSAFDLAMDIENSSITIPALVPWCILITVPLSIFGVTHEAVPFAIYIYAIPLVHLINKILRRDL